MKIKNSKLKIQNYVKIFLMIFLFVTCHLSLVTASEKWPGVDESVVERFAKEHGREAKDPLLNTDQGDLLLFVFLLAGAVGGFVAGYYWKTLTEVRSQKPEVRIQTTENR